MIDFNTGSPPPMRGKGELPCTVDRSDGITPAYAGKRGYFKMIWNNIKGSPPPMRGKGKNRRSGFPHTGITPAYAGKRFQKFR